MFFNKIEANDSCITCTTCRLPIEQNSLAFFTTADGLKCDPSLQRVVDTPSVRQYCWNCYLQCANDLLLKGPSFKGYTLLTPEQQHQLHLKIDYILSQQAIARKSKIREQATSNLQLSLVNPVQRLTVLCLSVIIQHEIHFPEENLPKELIQQFRDFLYLFHEKELLRCQMTGIQMKILLKKFNMRCKKGTKNELEDQIIMGQISRKIPRIFEIPIPTSKKNWTLKGKGKM